jgi:hypothetical protein
MLFALITLVALFYAEENFRGKLAYQRFRAEAEAKGLRLDWASYVLPPVPDHENFAKTPLLVAIGYKDVTDTNLAERLKSLMAPSGMGQYVGNFVAGRPADLDAIKSELRGNPQLNLPPEPSSAAADVLAALEPMEPYFQELRTASHRRYARFDMTTDQPCWFGPTPNFIMLRSFSQRLSVRASALLALGKTDAAMADIKVIHKLAEALTGHPMLVSAMIRVAILGGPGLQPVWEGMVSNRWSDAQLKELQQLLGPVNLPADVEYALMGGELAGINLLAEKYAANPSAIRRQIGMSAGKVSLLDRFRLACIDLAPRGWVYQNQLVHNQCLIDGFKAAFQADGRISPLRCERSMERVKKAVETPGLFNYIARMATPNYAKAISTSVLNHDLVHMAEIVCGLEQYKRAEGQYPDDLAAIVPRYLAKLPNDPITGKPPIYRRSADGKFLLYSVGQNEQDDGGLRMVNGGQLQREVGDWVWPVAIDNPAEE